MLKKINNTMLKEIGNTILEEVNHESKTKREDFTFDKVSPFSLGPRDFRLRK